MGEVGGEGRGGEGPPAAAECLRLREDRSREGRRRSEEERGNLPPDCARSLGGEKVRQNFPGPREAGRQEMRAAGRGGRKGPCDGRGRSRRRRPRLPHPPGRAAARGAGGGGSAGRAAGGGEECAREARGRTAGRRGGGPGAGGGGGGGVRAGERRNLEPELRGWRRAGLGDVTALESAECRAAGAPCAGPGEVAHFWCGGFGKCLKRPRSQKQFLCAGSWKRSFPRFFPRHSLAPPCPGGHWKAASLALSEVEFARRRGLMEKAPSLAKEPGSRTCPALPVTEGMIEEYPSP
ncbi:translation initiation factor IF-2-like isoform X1 [Lutra lutra]|uniref:translation initiation factor IF-2-like isoform X1 n=1 Tax=Lutra lutra TaxID=9657 RepID=UPI001FD07624|nr:translation initiation factor IF-2-like isoform X1 [Lutra lutra]